MKIALISASGFVGTGILNEALPRGYEATAIVRNIEDPKFIRKRFTVAY